MSDHLRDATKKVSPTAEESSVVPAQKPVDLDALEAMEKLATPGPVEACVSIEGDTHEVVSDDGDSVATHYSNAAHLVTAKDDATYHAALRNSFKSLAAELRMRREQVRMAKAYLSNPPMYRVSYNNSPERLILAALAVLEEGEGEAK